MEIFPWDHNFETGIELIDAQHKNLVALLNKLCSHLAYQSESPALTKVFDDLTAYAAYHFKAEEAIWAEAFLDDACYLTHKSSHQSFIAEVAAFKSQETAESQEVIMERLVMFLADWLAFHILDSDKRMAKVVLARQQGLSLLDAKAKADADMDHAKKILIDVILAMYQKLSSRTLQLIREVQARLKTESKLRLADSAIESTMEAIVITDADLTILKANPAFCNEIGIDEQALPGRKLLALKPSLADELIWSTLREKGHWTGEIWGRNPQGEFESEWLTFSVIRDDAGQIGNYVAIFFSISDLLKRQQILEYIAYHDPLTGLPNRRLLLERLNQAMLHAGRNQNSLAICYLDLDGFKQVNDDLGHAAGDYLLQEIAKRFRKLLRSNDTVSRLGGDEFVLLFNDLQKMEDVGALLDRVLAAVSPPVVIDGNPAVVTASIGVSFFPADGNDAGQLLERADAAMYQAKNSGKCRYYLGNRDA